MSNEKTSEDAGWVSRLDQLDRLPGSDESWKETAWDRLYARSLEGEALREDVSEADAPLKSGSREDEPRRKRILWYWAAAACLLLAGTFYLLPVRPVEHASAVDKRTGASTSASEKVPVGERALSKGRIQGGGGMQDGRRAPDGETAQTGESVMSGKETPTRETAPMGKESLTKKEALPMGESPGKKERVRLPMASVMTVDPGADPIREQPAGIADSIAPALVRSSAPLITKQKLRVVHINELGGPETEDIPMDHFAVRMPFRVHLTLNYPPPMLLVPEQAINNSRSGITKLFSISLKN